MSFSAVIITFNEERNIGKCINALSKVCEDIIVVDSESKDNTVSIAREMGAKTFIREFDLFGAAKNYGIDRAENDWIISVDADEFISEKLAQSFRDLKPKEGEVYAFNILPNYCGKWIKHSGWYPDWNIRVFNRKVVRWNNDPVHEKLLGLEGKKIVRLAGVVEHYSYYSIDEHQQKLEFYAQLGAESWIKKQKKPGMLKMTFSPSFRFFRNFFLKLGFLDGYYGWVIARNEAEMVRQRNKYYRRMMQKSNTL